MGSLVKLMENEKVVVALVRIRDKGESEHSMPLGFKVNKEKIPAHIKFDKFHSNNMHNLTVPGVKPLPVMIVCLGERKIPGLTNKINHWIQVSGISLTKIDKSMFKPVLLKEFNSFMKAAESTSKAKQKEVPPEVVTLTDENSSGASKPTLSAAESSKTSFSGSTSFFKEHGSSYHDYENLKDLISSTKSLAIKYRASAKVLSSTDPNKPFFIETAQMFMNLLEIVDNLERSIANIKQESPGEPFPSDLRIISEEDQTREQGKTTFIEGLLPVKTSKYKKAIASLPAEINDREPSHVIATIAKLCFPDHWINGVTLKGSGGNKSLFDLWSFENPLKFPMSGTIDKQLGYDRYQALLDHTMRKCGKKSYHSEAEKHLSSVISKAIHYKRTKINQPKGWDDISDEEEDSDSSDDEIIIPPRPRSLRHRIGESPIASKHKDLGSKITVPIVSMEVGSPISYAGKNKSGNESETTRVGDDHGDQDLNQKGDQDLNQKGDQDSKQKGDQESNEKGDQESTQADDQDSTPKGDAKEEVVKKDQEKEEVPQTESSENEHAEPKQESPNSDDDDFKWDDDDHLLGEFNYLQNSVSPPPLFDDPDPASTSVEKDKSGGKVHQLSLKVVQPVFSSTPVKQKTDQSQEPMPQITPIRSLITNVKETGIPASIPNDSGIEVSAIEAGSVDLSVKSADQSTSASTSDNKRKLSDASTSDTKKIKNNDDDPGEESDASTLSAGSVPPMKFMDPRTLAFLQDPANAAFLQQLIASSTLYQCEVSKNSTNKLKNAPIPKKLKLSTGLSRSYRSNLKVYGKSKILGKTSNENISGSNFNSLSEPGTSGTQISVTVTTDEIQSGQSSKVSQEVNLNQKVDQDSIYAIVFPLIICEDVQIRQPVLLTVKKSDFSDYEIELPFSAFMDMKINCFKFKVGKYSFRGHLMALGESPLELKISLQENINANDEWKGLPKMKRLGFSNLQHCPLEEGEDIPSYRVMSSIEIKDLLESYSRSSQNISGSSQKDSPIITPVNTKDSGKKKSLVLSDDEGEVNKKKKAENEILDSRSKHEETVTDLSVIDSLIEKVNSQVAELIARKSFLSNLDTTGSTLITIINVLDDFRRIIDHKKQNDLDNSNQVPKEDATFKISQKNQIFIEGLIQLDLDLYETATKQAKPNNPSSMAYSLVKYSFPKQYIEDVVLGKKFYDKKDIDDFIKERERSCKTKFPLAFIWGFKDPYNARLEGECDYKLGNERIRAFFNHIFRKSKIFNYSKEAEKAVRRRIMKEFCALNSEISEKKDQEEVNFQDQESQHSQESNTFDLDCFSDD
uniref:Uncharacterized protein n=1 Tax=Tetranychus urticae TaxID=32264 RepID=T1KU52_TETUR